MVAHYLQSKDKHVALKTAKDYLRHMRDKIETARSYEIPVYTGSYQDRISALRTMHQRLRSAAIEGEVADRAIRRAKELGASDHEIELALRDEL